MCCRSAKTSPRPNPLTSAPSLERNQAQQVVHRLLGFIHSSRLTPPDSATTPPLTAQPPPPAQPNARAGATGAHATKGAVHAARVDAKPAEIPIKPQSAPPPWVPRPAPTRHPNPVAVPAQSPPAGDRWRAHQHRHAPPQANARYTTNRLSLIHISEPTRPY